MTGGKGDETQKLACRYISTIGGSDNLTGINACITRMSLSIKDTSLVNDAVAKKLGAQGVIRLNKESLQIIVGTRAEIIASAMRTVLANGPANLARAVFPTPVATPAPRVETPSAAGKLVVVSLISPMTGDVVPLEHVQDEAFDTRAVGEGISIRPTDKLRVLEILCHSSSVLKTRKDTCPNPSILTQH